MRGAKESCQLEDARPKSVQRSGAWFDRGYDVRVEILGN